MKVLKHINNTWKSQPKPLEKLPSTLTKQDEGIQESLCFPRYHNFGRRKNFRGQRVDLNDLPGVAADEEAEQAFLGRPGDMRSKLGEI